MLAKTQSSVALLAESYAVPPPEEDSDGDDEFVQVVLDADGSNVGAQNMILVAHDMEGYVLHSMFTLETTGCKSHSLTGCLANVERGNIWKRRICTQLRLDCVQWKARSAHECITYSSLQ